MSLKIWLPLNGNIENQGTLNTASRLPSGYTEVKYLRTTGSQHIDTGVIPDADMEIECTYRNRPGSEIADTPLFGSRDSSYGNSYTVWAHPLEYNNTGVDTFIFNGLELSFSKGYPIGTWQSIYLSKTQFINNNQKLNLSASAGTPNLSIILCGLRNGNEIDSRKFIGDIIKFSIKKGSSMVCNFIPALRNSDNKPGMYDTVTGTFYTNAGSGEFSVGPTVTCTITNNGATIDNNGKIGKCYSLAGGTITATAPKVTNKITVAAWIKAPDNRDVWRRVCGMQSTSTSWQSASALLMLKGTNLYFSISNGSTCTSGGCVFNIGDSTNWFHACGTYDGTTARLYVNGVLKKEVAITTTIENTPVWLGGTSAGERFTGKLNDFRLYDHCLSPKEVKELSKGLVLHYPLNDAACSKNLASNTDWERTSNNEYMRILDTYQDMGIGEYTLSCEMKVAAGTPSVCIYYDDGTYTKKYNYSVSDIYTNGVLNGKLSQQWQKVVCRLTFTVSTEDSTVMPHISTYYTYGSGAIVSVRNPKLEKGWNPNPIYTNSSYNIVYDCSGYQNNGTITGTLSCSTDSPRYKVSSVFDGSSAKIVNNSFPTSIVNGTNPFTVCGWARYIEGNTYNPLFNIGASNGGITGICLHQTGSRIEGQDVNGALIDNRAGAGYSNGEWVYQCIVYDGINIKRYLNGNTTPVQSLACLGFKSNNSRLCVGGFWGTSFKGSLSDFRVYATALSAEDIKELYNTSAYVTNNGTLLTYNLEE